MGLCELCNLRLTLRVAIFELITLGLAWSLTFFDLTTPYHSSDISTLAFWNILLSFWFLNFGLGVLEITLGETSCGLVKVISVNVHYCFLR